MFLRDTVCLSLTRRLGRLSVQQFSLNLPNMWTDDRNQPRNSAKAFLFLKCQSAAEPEKSLYVCVCVCVCVHARVCQVTRDWQKARPELIVCSASIPCQPAKASRFTHWQTLFISITPLLSVSAGKDTDFHLTPNTTVKYFSESSRSWHLVGGFYPRHITVHHERLHF